LAALLIVGGVANGVRAGYLHSSQRAKPLVFSDNAMLHELWTVYKAQNLDPATHRTLDKQQGGITTSEGESYTMLRATWIDDKLTFDQNWLWTKNNLQRPDKLFSWKYGPLGNGSYGILSSVGGNNTASDGDSDIALSLLMAYSRWGDRSYLEAAKEIIPHIWKAEVVDVNGKPVLVANDLERNNKDSVIVNPSYFAPYAYKTFAKVDPTHNWKALSDNSYTLLAELSKNPLGANSSDGLEPDWVQLDRATGKARAASVKTLKTDYSYDAMRTSWRLALDYQWFHDARDKTVLQQFSFLSDEWTKHHALKATYARDGATVVDYESAAGYGGAIGYFSVVDPATAKQVYDTKLLPLYSPDGQGWRTTMSYYDDNWVWFGLALNQGALPNLTEQS
jgi:endo-1,4-beta-D-glucanase Y